MGCGYISSNDNRLYAALELSYGQVPPVESRHRFPAVKLVTQQSLDRPARRDKTGSRTFPGNPAGLRKRTTFNLTTYMTSWAQQGEPAYGALFQAGLGAAPQIFAGATAGASDDPKKLVFTDAQQIAPGQAVTFGGELRFVSSIISDRIVELNAPFSVLPAPGSPIGPTVTYALAEDVGTVSLFDYWSPDGAVNRILNGAAVNRLRLKVNGDYHEFEFDGTAQDLLDSASFAAGQGELTEFPAEPAADLFDYTIIPGHLGQAWLGNTPDRFYTVTAAELTVDNGIQTRTREFGTDAPLCLSAGQRTVTADFALLEMNDAATKGLYQAARQLSPIAVMFQLGQQAGQLFGACLNAVVPEVPEFNDGDTRLEWRFSNCRAQGTVSDEIVVAFG